MPAVTAILWTYRKDKQGRSPVYLRIADGEGTKYRSLRYYVKASEWNEKAGRVSGRHPDHEAINTAIGDAVAAAQREVYRRRAEGEEVSAEAVAQVITSEGVVHAGPKGSREDFFAFADALVEGYRARGQVWTHARYKSVLGKMRAYTGEPFPFSGLTPAFLRRYEEHLAAEYKNGVNMIAATMNALKAMVRRAVAEGKTAYADNPFLVHKIREEPTERVRLTLDEVRAMERLDLGHDPRLQLARDTFLLQFYLGGVRFSDIALLRWGSVTAEGVRYVASKTKKTVAVPVVPQAQRILDLYCEGDPPPDAFVLPHLAGYDVGTPEGKRKAIHSRTTLTNKLLKDVAALAEVKKNVSTHVARHSFADLARRSGWGLYDISKALQHSSVKVTERYLSRMDTGGMEGRLTALFDQ